LTVPPRQDLDTFNVSFHVVIVGLE
jgi:hypothetical protein